MYRTEPERFLKMSDCSTESNFGALNRLSEEGMSAVSAIEAEVVRLFDELRGPLLRYLAAFPLSVSDSEDVVQEAFLSLYRNLRKGSLHRNSRGWLFRAAHHLALKKRQHWRKDQEHRETLTGAEASAIDPGPNPEDRLLFNQTQRRLLSVVQALPERHRCCLYLRAEGLRYREIAEIVGISLGSVSLVLERSLALISRAAQR